MLCKGKVKHCLPDWYRRPIVVIGMHRAGTSVVAKLVDACDVWMGSQLDVNHESSFFQGINKSILREQGEFWHRCEKTRALLDEGKKLQDWAEMAGRVIRRQILVKHFGLAGFRHAVKSFVQSRYIGWGWKDPRTTLFVSLWKRVFPEARLVGVLREPKDVCVSLYYRELERYEAKASQGKARGGFEFPMQRCFDIWKLYTDLTLKAVQMYSETSLLLKYEELRNQETMSRLASFMGGRTDPELLMDIVSYRSGRYTLPPGMERFEESISRDSLVLELGYGDGGTPR